MILALARLAFMSLAEVSLSGASRVYRYTEIRKPGSHQIQMHSNLAGSSQVQRDLLSNLRRVRVRSRRVPLSLSKLAPLFPLCHIVICLDLDHRPLNLARDLGPGPTFVRTRTKRRGNPVIAP